MKALHKHGWSIAAYKDAVVKNRGVAGWEKLQQDIDRLSNSLF